MNSVSTQPQSVRGPLQTLSIFLTPNSQQRWHPPLGRTPSQPCPDSCPCPFSMQEPSCLSSGSLEMSLVPPSLLCSLCHYQQTPRAVWCPHPLGWSAVTCLTTGSAWDCISCRIGRMFSFLQELQPQGPAKALSLSGVVGDIYPRLALNF